jgi:hypothetical protein
MYLATDVLEMPLYGAQGMATLTEDTNHALADIATLYGRSTANFVALQLEYPR